MKQVGLVFWKDARHLWPELSVYAVVLAVYFIVAPQTWPGRTPNSFLAMFATLLKLLIGLSWLVLVTRVVHADSLVGEDQFWITRPYRWSSLLAAKMLFVAVCMGIPFVAMQWTILLGAGLNPFAAKAAMAIMLLRFSLNVCLPMLVIASVTDGLPMAFTFLTGLLVVWAGLLQFILSGTDMRMSPPFEFAVYGVLFGGLMLGILIYQYARRRTKHSRIAIAAMLALFLLLTFGYDRAGFGAPVKALIRQHYPLKNSLHLVLADSVPYDERGKNMQVPREDVEVKLPVQLEGLPIDHKLRELHVAVSLEAGGIRYAPAWQDAEMGDHTIAFLLPKAEFERFAAVDAKVHLELVGVELRPARVVTVAAAENFAGPMDGRCSLIDAKVYCRYAYREWIPTRIEATTCGGAIAATLRHVPAGGTFDPVVNEAVPSKGNVCAGDSIRFTEYESVGEFRTVLDAQAIKIGLYRAGNT